VPSIEIAHPLEGSLILAISGLSTAGFLYIVEKNKRVRDVIGRLTGQLWEKLTIEDPETLSSPKRKQYQEKKSAYNQYASRQLPLIVFVLVLSFGLVYTYSGMENLLLRLSIVYVGLGIFLGAFENAFGSKGISMTNSEKIEKEVREIISSQLEVSLLLFAAFCQYFSTLSFNPSSLSELFDFLLRLGVTFLLAGFAIYLAYKTTKTVVGIET